MSAWQPGQPVVTREDEVEWQAWRKHRKLASQRARRATLARIDYYPSPEALAAIRANAEWNTPVSATIDRLLLAELPE